MDRVELFCGGQAVGSVTLRRDGWCTEVRAAMPDPGDGIYRVALVGEQGRLQLGVMEPAGADAVLCRRPYSRDVERLGRILRGEAGCGERAGRPWRKTGSPAGLFQRPFLAARLSEYALAWWQREGELLRLALPLDEKQPFPLESMFCLGRIRCVEGHWCVVYAFDGTEMPVPQEK